jgi:hypothetical protein
MRKLIWVAVAALALGGAAPAIAQEEPTEEDVFGAMMSMFAPPALTAEEEARLPAAQAIVAKIVPPGTMGEMMNSMFSGILGPLIEMGAQPSSAEAAKMLGLDPGDLELDTEQSAEVLALLDPAWKEREERTLAATQVAIAKLMTAMEPATRDAMAQLYAINFSGSELADIDAFFSTPSGAAYARRSFAMASDPRMMGAVMQSMPEMMGSFAEMEAEMAAAVADLPPMRTFADLDAAQLARLAELTGLDHAAIEQGMARAATGEEEDEGFEDYEEAEESDSY